VWSRAHWLIAPTQIQALHVYFKLDTPGKYIRIISTAIYVHRVGHEHSRSEVQAKIRFAFKRRLWYPSRHLMRDIDASSDKSKSVIRIGHLTTLSAHATKMR
jgi:hypothetical protein